jgi:hypothetical protein
LQSAKATIIHSLLSIVCENAPALIEPIKEKITDVADLKLKMNEVTSNISITAFENEIKRSLLQFDLIKESSQYSCSLSNCSFVSMIACITFINNIKKGLVKTKPF